MDYSKICITGTPGTGKTTISKILAEKLNITYMNINEFAEKKGLIHIDKNNNKEIDPKKLCPELKKIKQKVIIDSHIAQNCKNDIVFVLRTNPEELEKRLKKRKWNNNKIKTNIKAEILDSCLIDAIETNENVYEIDTSSHTELETVYIIIDILNNKNIKNKYKPGNIDWTETYFSYLSEKE